MKKKITAAFLALLFCFGLASCEKNIPVSTETETVTAENVTEEPAVEETIDENDLSYEVNSWIGFAEEGTLKKAGTQKVYQIKSAADLDAFREPLLLSEEEEKTLFEDPRDHVLLIEIVSATEKSSYGVTSIFWEGTEVMVELHEEVMEEITPSHTFILFHMPYSLVGNANVNINVITV